MNKLRHIFEGYSGKIYQAGAILAFFSLASRLVGLWRDRILAGHFGASTTLDIYYSAFKIPDFIFNLIVLGAVSSAFIPVFVEKYRFDKIKAWRLSQNFLTIIFLIVFSACTLIFIFVKPLSFIFIPGFIGVDRELAISLTRLMLLSPIIFSLSTVIGSVLQALQRFWAYAIAPIFYNLGIIIGAIYFAPLAQSYGYHPIYGLGLGVILGALLHLAVQLPAVLNTGFRFGILIDLADDSLKKIFKLMVPRTIGLSAYSFDSMITNAIASTMSAGSIAVFNFANNLQFVPISVIGISMATAVFPSLSFHASGQEKQEFRRKLNSALISTFFVVLLLAVFIAIFSPMIVALLFGNGLFSTQDISQTAGILSIFMIGVVAQSLVPILSRAFYAMQNTSIPVTISILTMATNICLGLLFSFVFNWGIRGLALAFSISGNINFILLWVLFRRKFGKLINP